MFLSPYFWGCKYTNYFLFINKNTEFQCFGLLITLSAVYFSTPHHQSRGHPSALPHQPFCKNREQHHLSDSVSFCIFGSWKLAERSRHAYGIISANHQIMDTDRKWVVVRIDGKIAGISTDYRILADIAARLSAADKSERRIGAGTDAKTRTEKKHRRASDSNVPFNEIKAETVSFDEIWKLRKECAWDDLMLFGTDFQKNVWRKLWELTHQDSSAERSGNVPAESSRLISYSDFAGMCQNRAGVRAVAHAIGLNPVSVVIPCHLVVPKETIDKIKGIRQKAESTIFKGEDLCLESILRDKSTDFGEYSLGRRIKRELISRELL